MRATAANDMGETISWRVAYFSPLPPAHSGIADYSYELLPELARQNDVTLFVTDPEATIPPHANLNTQHIRDYPALRHTYDIAIYQMGNSEHHEAIYGMALQHPGIIVLHDYFLHHLIVARTIGRGSFPAYIREMGYALGIKGTRRAHQVRTGLREIPFFELPLNARVLDSSLGAIVHSEYVRQRILARHPRLSVTVIPQSVGIASGSKVTGETTLTTLSRQELGCPQDRLVLGTAGQVTKSKQVTLALEAFQRLGDEFPEAMYAVIGEEPGHDIDLTDWLAQRGLEDRVIWTGYVPDGDRFTSWIAAADILVNLRHPTVGETSRTALIGLATGRPVIVVDDGWYAELPDDVCVKVPPDDIDALIGAMRRMAGDETLRREIGRRAAEYARHHHTPARVAELYTEFIGDVIGQVTRRHAE